MPAAHPDRDETIDVLCAERDKLRAEIADLRARVQAQEEEIARLEERLSLASGAEIEAQDEEIARLNEVVRRGLCDYMNLHAAIEHIRAQYPEDVFVSGAGAHARKVCDDILAEHDRLQEEEEER